MKLFLKGDRCFSEKCSFDKRPEQTPGEHGLRRPKFSEFGIRLREKQKVKRMYGLSENQFRKYFVKAARKKGVTGSLLISNLERRLDNVVYRLGFASSRKEARNMVRHGHFVINNRKVDIPSYEVNADDVIKVNQKSSKMERIVRSLEGLGRRGFPEWLDVDSEKLSGNVKRLPIREDVTIPIEEQLVVEFYSRV
jgi:small subunit ribosomal protein S4